MEKFPHEYFVKSSTSIDAASITIEVDGLQSIESAAPKQFGGPGDMWSPEDFFVASVGDCFILTFRVLSKMSKLSWKSIQCDVTGILDRVERKTSFTKLKIKSSLVLEDVKDRERAETILHKSEENCLITNSLNSEVLFEIGEITTT